VDDGEQLRQWVQEKLEEGYSKQRLKHIMEDRDLDPSVVDELSESEPDFQAFGGRDEETEQDGVKQARNPNGSGASTSLSDRIPSKRQLSFTLVLLLVSAAGVVFALGEIDRSTAPTSNTKAEGLPRGCSDIGDIGIRLREVSRFLGSTTADVETIRGNAWITVEVYEDGELRSSERQYIEDSGEITVGAVGDRVVAHPVNCNLYRDSVEY
jgi:hypothetical protein